MEALFMLLGFVGLLGVGLVLHTIQRSRQRRFIEQFEFPPTLRDELRDRHQLSWPDAERVLDALRQWFLACLESQGKMIAMPSRVVDDAWHEFILMTRQYHEFCKKAFGGYLHHTPEAVSDEPVGPKIPATLAALEKHKNANVGSLPSLFTIDADLGIERGRRWTRERVAQVEAGVFVGCFGGADVADGGDTGCSGDGCGGDGCGAD